jgi:hypothetical protein
MESMNAETIWASERVREAMKSMTEDQRVYFMLSLRDQFCDGCGRDQYQSGTCHCQNDN